MPKPKKGESKQDYLQRCTAEVMKKEGKEADQAFQMCNMMWDDNKKQRGKMTLTAPLTLAPAAGEGPKGFLITAFTGAVMDRFWRPLVIVTAGIKTKPKLPALREHARDRVVGYVTKSWIDGQNLLMQGNYSEKTRDGQEVRDLQGEGFPWQASIGVWPSKIKVLESDKESETVNGREIIGPAEIWLESYVREVSFCALGADDETAAISLTENQTKVPVSIEWAGPNHKEEEAMPITLAQLEAEAPALLQEIRDQAQAGVTLAVLVAQEPAEAEKLRVEGETRERQRVVEMLEYEGDAAITREAVKGGQTFAEMVKLDRQAEKKGREQALETMKGQTTLPLGQQSGQGGGGGENFEAKVQQYMAGEKLSRADALKQAAREFPELHAAYIARHNPAKQ